MALDTRTNLLTAIADWLNRSDLTSTIPDFITLAEAEVRRRLRRTTLSRTLTIDAGSVTGPSDMAEPRALWLVTSDTYADVPLRLCTPEMLAEVRAQRGSTGRPTHYAFYAGQFHFAPTPDQTYSGTLLYVENVTPLGSEYVILPETTATTGSNASPTSAFLIKANAGWTLDAYNGYDVLITAGTGIGQRRTIVDTVDTYLEVSEEWDYIPDSTTRFKIVDPARTVDTNGVLQDAPDVYLFGALLQAAPYLEHDERIAVWYQKFNDAIDQLNEQRERESYGGGLKESRLPFVIG